MGPIISLPDKLEHELNGNKSLLPEMPRKLAIVTSTMYRKKGQDWDPIVKTRADLALRMFQEASQAGFKVYCVDENSDSTWLQEARSTGVKLIDLVADQYKGTHPMGQCRRQAFAAAANDEKELLTWLDPEKHSFIWNYTAGLSPIALAATPVHEGKVDMVIPRRVDVSSYPVLQQASELTGNLVSMGLVREYMAKKGFKEDLIEAGASFIDHYSGPKIFSLKDVHHVLSYSGKIGGNDHDRWESVHMIPYSAIKQGQFVRGVPVPFFYPPEQREVEQGDISMMLKRIEQLGVLTKAVSNFLDS